MNDTVFKTVIFHLWRNTFFVLIGMFIWPYLVLKLRSQLELEKLYEWRIWRLVTSRHGSIWIEYMTIHDKAWTTQRITQVTWEIFSAWHELHPCFHYWHSNTPTLTFLLVSEPLHPNPLPKQAQPFETTARYSNLSHSWSWTTY